MAYVIVRPADHQGWLAERKKGIGSSEAGTIMGVNKFDTPYRLWRRKREIDPPVQTNEAMELGHHLEPAVASLFAARTGAYIRKDSEGDWLAVDAVKEHLRVSPDRLYYRAGDRHTRRNLRILECKTTSVEIDPANIPVYWYCQIQYQMGVMGVKAGAVAWISSFPRLHFDYVEVEFNEMFYKALIEVIDEFWFDCVICGIPPKEMDAEDAGLKSPQAEPGQVVEADHDTVFAYESLKVLMGQIKAMEENKANLETQLKSAMGTAETLVSPEGKVLAQWRNVKDVVKFNQKAFQEADPGTYSLYLETSKGGRRFSVK